MTTKIVGSCQLTVNCKAFCIGGCAKRNWEREAEESPLPEAVAMERLIKTQLAGKCSAGAVVNCKVCRSATALQLRVVPCGVYKWLLNPIIQSIPRLESHNPKTVTVLYRATYM
jgi:hypothetical protein